MFRGPSYRSHRQLSLSAICAAVLLGSSCGQAADQPTPEEKQPNVILLVMDTTRADRLSLYGWKNETTPSLNALAADSVVYTEVHSTAPWTLPAHMSMFTGLLPGQHGATLRIFDAEGDLSMEEILGVQHRPTAIDRMLPVVLKRHGYQTLGISNNPWISNQMGFDAGFDSFLFHSPKDKGEQALQDAPALPPIALSPALASASFGRTVGRLNNLIGRDGLHPPFFLFLNLIDAHYPYLSPPTFRTAFGGDPSIYPVVTPSELAVMAGAAELDFDSIRPFYDASVLYMDAVIGELVDWLREVDLYESSMIIITSDHGEHLGEQGKFSHQLSVEEELLHVPLIIKYPNELRRGTRDSNPTASTLDVYATILAAAGVRLEEGGATASRNLAALSTLDRPFAIAEYYDSTSYLQLFKNLNPGFDIAQHRGAKRVLYAGGLRFTFKGTELSRVDSLESQVNSVHSDDLKQAAQRWLDDYVEDLPRIHRPRQQGKPVEPGFVESLRALGYVE